MSKEGLLIALLKSERSLAELHESNSDNAVIGKTRKNFNKLRDKFSRSKIKKNQRKTRQKIEKNENFSRLEKKKLQNILLNQKNVFTNLKSILIMMIQITKE